MSSRYNPIAAAVKGGLMLGAMSRALAREAHAFGDTAPPPANGVVLPPSARSSEEYAASLAAGNERYLVEAAEIDPAAYAALVLPRKQATRDMQALWVAERDTCLKACIEHVLGVELTDPAAQLEGHQLLELHDPAPDENDQRGSTWALDSTSLLWASAPSIRTVGDEVRALWVLQLLVDLPAQVLASLPAGVRPWREDLETAS